MVLFLLAAETAILMPLLCVVCFVAPGCATQPSIEARIKDYGVFEAKAARAEKSAGTALGHRVILDDIRLARKTEDIAAAKGTRFGLRYIIKGSKKGVPVQLTVRVSHPEIENPQTKRKSTSEQWQQKVIPGQLSYAGFTFDSGWEMAPGIWTFQIYHGQQKLAEKSFTVLRPGQGN